MKRLILTVLMLMAIPLSSRADGMQASAASTTPALPMLGVVPGDASPLQQMDGTHTIGIIDGLTFNLDNGHIVELSGIWIPQGQGFEPSNEEVAAKALIDKIFDTDSNREIYLYQKTTGGDGRVNRLGHELAQIVRKNGNVWLQGALLVNGLAQVWPTPSNPELADKMYALEDRAIAAGRGLWAKDSPYRLMQADGDVGSLNRFAVVEGVVKSIATIDNMVYLNFGEDWHQDFSIGIPTPVRQQMARNNIDVMKLQGQRVRVRGWLRYYNGPYIELETQIDLQTPDTPMHDNIVADNPQLSIVNTKQRPAPVVHSVGEVMPNHAP